MAPDVGYDKDEQLLPPARKILDGVSALPGVESAALTSLLPVTYNGNTTWMRIVGRPFHGEHNEVNERDVTPDFFKTIRARLVSGRYFTATDDANRPGVAIVNEALVRQYFPGEDPIGKQIGDPELSKKSLRQIVGVVNDVKEGALDTEIWPAIYLPFEQDADGYYSVIVRTSQAPESIISSLLASIHQSAPDFATVDETTMEPSYRRLASGIPASLVGLADWRLCGAGLDAWRGGIVRRDRVFSEPAHARDWSANGVGRAACRCLSADYERGRMVDGESEFGRTGVFPWEQRR